MNRIKNPFSLLLCLLLALGVSKIFYPGLYSSDSLNLAYESALGFFNDLHSTLMPLAVRLVLKAGGSFGLVTLTQSLAGFFGVRQMILAVTRFSGGLDRQADWIAVFIIACLASPLTPLSLFLLTLWNDTWLAILLVWIVALLLDLYHDSKVPRPFSIRLTVTVLLIGLAMLARQNALVIYPALALALEILMRRKSIHWLPRLLALLSPLMIYLSFSVYQYDLMKITRTNPERAVYALDLASMIVYDPTICQNLSITSCDLVLGVFPPNFRPGKGAIDLTSNQGAPPHYFFFELMDYSALGSEFATAAHDHPLLLLTVKLLNFVDYIRPDSTRFFYQKQITSNELGLSFDERFVVTRNAWFSVTDWILHDNLLRWFSFVHALWLVVNILDLLLCAWLAVRFHDNRALFFGSILLVPASYYASYLIALTASEFRFMYPSMLVVQVITLTFLFSMIAGRRPRISPPAA